MKFTHPIINAVLSHLGGTELTYEQFRQLPVLHKEGFRDLCALNGARDPTEIEWREAACACEWIPESIKEQVAELSSEARVSTCIPTIVYGGFYEGWKLQFRFQRKTIALAAVTKIQALWRRFHQRAL